ncbi:MAG: succinate dehydrogenase iron-sulfur subunit [Candidatus Omnitrophica bacterium]|nr:succinate dehydrogenase iron-sulfur subunit [Candidatus Omnitrophota bacterium]
MIKDKITIKIKRQDTPQLKPRWETFVLKYRPGMNVITCLMDIRKNPRTVDGIKTTPVKWEQNCLEEVCGSCTMVINGKVEQACSALVDHLEDPITIEPMTKFPLVCDLVVDRSRMFEALKQVKAWIPIDGTYDLGPGPKIYPEEQQDMYAFSKCMTCGCCLEACPQINSHSPFIGAAAIGQVKLFNAHPTGHENAGERLEALMTSGGAQDCGNAQNCVEVCPHKIPLTTSIAEINRQITRKLFGLFKK